MKTARSCLLVAVLVATGCKKNQAPQDVVVPSVVGMTQTAAEADLAAARLATGRVTTASSQTVAAGLVMSQSPAAGTRVASGTAVDFVVSTGPAPVSIAAPDLVGMTEANARAAIAAAGLTVGTVTRTASATVPSGSVVSQNPAAGTLVASGTAVDLVVSTGPAAVAAPDVVGMTEANARAAIAAAGLTVGTVTQTASATVPAGSVVSQNPAAGTSLQPGATVDLVVSSGPPLVTPDPATIATPLDANGSTGFADANSFLYTGANPVQTGVAPGAIQPLHISVLRGKVLDRAGAPIAGVRVTAAGHPELGETGTRADGLFDLAVNGGGPVLVRYNATGYLPAVRTAEARWREFTRLPDVVLIPLDPATTVVDLSQTGFQVARGSVVTDASGTRQATLLFPPGMSAAMIDPAGRTVPVSRLTIRATEYTVGTSGPTAMPGALPPTSGYTYAVELSADEALAAGATRVELSRPVITYVDDFIGFPVGSAVPAGSLDRSTGLWMGEPSGRVVAVVAVGSSGLADLDVDGSGVASGPAALAALGVTDAERARLGALYGAGKRLWRVPVAHFSAWDCNWPYVPARDALPPKQPLPRKPDPKDPKKPCNKAGSIIGCEDRSLGQRVPVTGTPFTLNYRSDRAPGHRPSRTLDVPLTGASLPASVRSVELEVETLGGTRTFSFAPGLNLRQSVPVDATDPYGRTVVGSAPFRLTLRYSYALEYVAVGPDRARAWAQVPYDAFQEARRQRFSATSIWLSQEVRGRIPGAPPRAGDAGAWTLDVHHWYDAEGGVLYFGDGTRRDIDATKNQLTVRRVAGNGGWFPAGPLGVPARTSALGAPAGIAVGRDGTLYVSSVKYHDVRKVGPDGIVTLFAGTTLTAGSGGDGGPATQASLNGPRGLALGPDGSVYIADMLNCRIRRVDPQGVIHTVAGNGTCPSPTVGQSELTGLATLSPADTNTQGRVAVGPSGSVYFATSFRESVAVYRIGTDGYLSRLAGDGGTNAGVPVTKGDGGPARLATIFWVGDIAVTPDESVYLAQGSNLRRIGPDGIIDTVAGSTYAISTFRPEVIPAVGTPIAFAAIAAAPDGRIFLSGDSLVGVLENNEIRFLAGPMTGFANLQPPDGAAGFNALIDPQVLALGPDGSIYTAWGGSSDSQVVRIRTQAPEFTGTDLTIASEDGTEVYAFTGAGRHLRTHDSATGAVRYTFTYDSAGLLATVTDASGNVTRIARAANGSPTAVQGPFGQTTALSVDVDGYLAAIANPAAETVSLAYAPGGLLASLTDPRGNVHRFTYDAEGNLVRDEDPTTAGAVLATTAETDFARTVAFTSRAGRVSSFAVSRGANGERIRTVRDPAGLSTTETESVTRFLRTDPDGTVTREEVGPDPRWNGQASLTVFRGVTVPTSFLERAETRSRSVVLADPNAPLSLTSQTDTVTVNGQVWRSVYGAAARRITTTSPAGRVTTTTFDALGRVVQTKAPGLLAIDYAYDTRGLVVQATQGIRVWSATYDSLARATGITDPTGLTTSLTWDAADRLASVTRPDLQTTVFGSNSSSNVVSVTPPGRTPHAFSYSSTDALASYAPPSVLNAVAATYVYDADGQVTSMGMPDGTSVTVGYDTAGRVATVTQPRGVTTYAYSPSTGRIASVTAPDGGQLLYTWDGMLATGVLALGTVNGNLQRTYDTGFRLASETVGGVVIGYTRDADGLLVSAGSINLTRDAASGVVTGTGIGGVSDATTYDGFGDVATYAATAVTGTGPVSLLSTTYARDALGRISTRQETAVAGVSHTFAYRYDTGSRLDQVTTDGVVSASYSYDANGNRTGATVSGTAVAATYDARDRLSTYGTATYVHGANGQLASRTMGGQTTQYGYDAVGNLLSVVPPTGPRIDYVIDGLDRRVGKKVNGALVQGFLYWAMLRPAAEVNGSGAIVNRFVYASATGAPAYVLKGASTYRVVADHVGSPRLVVDAATGSVVQRMDYDEFGNVTLDTNPGFQPFGFAGGLYDSGTGLVRFGARDYDPGVGRWAGPDPLRFDAGDSNLYAYAFGDPVNGTDPSGRSPCGKKPKSVKKGGKLYINARDVQILDQGSAKGNVLQKLQPGAEVEFLGYDPNDPSFVIVRSNGQVGETLKGNLSVDQPQPELPSPDTKPIGDQAYSSTGATKG